MKYIVDVAGRRLTVELDGADVRVDGEPLSATLETVQGTPVRLLRVGDTVHRVVARRDGARGSYRVGVDGWQLSADALDTRTRAIRDLAAASVAASGPAPLVAPMPGLIVRVLAEVGAEVSAGQPLVVVEAMKMENELRASAAGRITAVHAVAGTAVEKGTVLVELAAL
jgi:biotin carboxyl carrier protein